VVAVLEHLEVVLNSTIFRSSHRSCQFLRFLVEASVTGQTDQLKERSVGEKVFGRPPDYDTGQDSIVRVKASEVRRRLAQYYDLHPDAPLRIELPPGAYTPVFHPHAAVHAPVPLSAPSSPRFQRRWLLPVAALGLAVVTFAGWRASNSSLFGTFWEPFLSGPRDLVLCVPSPETYRIYGAGKAAVVDALRPRAPGQPPPAFPSEQAAQVRIVAEPGQFLGIGDAHAMTLLYGFALSQGRTPQIRIGNDTSFTELRAGPDILIGGFTNRWTMDLMKDARFAFESESSVYGIRDHSNGKFVCRKPASWEPRAREDCALITRLPNSKTGHPMIVAAGLDHFGTFEAGELLTRRSLLEPALRALPAGWQDRNLELVFRVEVVRDNVAPPQVLAWHVW
jgi:hypothetical protein